MSQILCGKPAHSVYSPIAVQGQHLIGVCEQHAAAIIQEARVMHRNLRMWLAAPGVTCGVVIGVKADNDEGLIDTAEQEVRTLYRDHLASLPPRPMEEPAEAPSSPFQPGGGQFGGGGASGDWDAPTEAPSAAPEPAYEPSPAPDSSPSVDTSYDSPSIAPDP